MKTFHKTIIFTKTPLLGYFRYKDIFQIYPAQLKNMPKSDLQRHHPVILEYCTTEDDNINVSTSFEGLKDLYSLTATTLTKTDKILSLLTVITNHLFFQYIGLDGNWGIPILEDNPGTLANEWSSKWNLPLFHWPGINEQLNITEFSQLNIQEVNYIQHFDYYLKDPNFDYIAKSAINFPNTINVVLDSYFSKEIEIQKILDTAISFSVSAIELKDNKKTLSIISSFTSLETMVNLEYRDFKPEICKTCGQLQYKVIQKYKDFLLKYIGNFPNNKKKFEAYYSLRSKIVHTGKRLITENLFSEISEKEKDEEFLNHMEILQLGKMAIIQWLLKNK